MAGHDEYHVYVIECTAKSLRVTVHIGIAKDVPKRMGDHRRGQVRATRGRQIKWLGNSGSMPHGSALRLEMQLKKLSPEEKRAWAKQQNQEEHGTTDTVASG